jgi:hypothetical protein
MQNTLNCPFPCLDYPVAKIIAVYTVYRVRISFIGKVAEYWPIESDHSHSIFAQQLCMEGVGVGGWGVGGGGHVLLTG